MKSKILMILLLIMSSIKIRAQAGQLNIITPCGNSISNSAYKLDYTIGEVATTTLSSNSHINTQGFNQPFYNNPTLISDLETSNPFIYPNPSTHSVYFSGLSGFKDYKWILTNSIGNTVYHGDAFPIDVSSLPSGFYLVKISSNASILYTFKFIKK